MRPGERLRSLGRSVLPQLLQPPLRPTHTLNRNLETRSFYELVFQFFWYISSIKESPASPMLMLNDKHCASLKNLNKPKISAQENTLGLSEPNPPSAHRGTRDTAEPRAQFPNP